MIGKLDAILKPRSIAVVGASRRADTIVSQIFRNLIEHGFKVTFRESTDMPAVKRRLKVPAAVESVHTAVVGGYFIEGHVPADDIKELLREKPKARGLAVPGLPMGAPGREARGSDSSCETGCTILERAQSQREGRREMYDTLLVGRDGKTSVYARH